jgi:hypothetical protein
MNDIGYLELSEKEKRELCERHVIIAQEEFLKSKRPDGYFQAFCPEQAAEIYGK